LQNWEGRGQVIVTDFDSLDLPSESFDAIYSLESIGYTKKPGRLAGALLADAQAGRKPVDPLTGVVGSLSA